MREGCPVSEREGGRASETARGGGGGESFSSVIGRIQLKETRLERVSAFWLGSFSTELIVANKYVQIHRILK